jgi:hypothetical protein
MNFVPATAVDGKIASPILTSPLPVPANLKPGGKVAIGIRPEQVRMVGKQQAGSVPAVLVEQAIGIAGRYLTKVRIGDTVLKVNTESRPPAPLGGTEHLIAPHERLMLFCDGQRVAS